MKTEHACPDDLAALRAAFDGDDRGGASPAGWDAVRAYEAHHGIVLPEPYRTFVAEVADGCAAGPPVHGLVPLAEPPSDRGDGGPVRDLGRPFPLTEAWLWEEDDDEPSGETRAVLDQVFGHGSIVLGTDGCGMDWHLIVTGAHRGHVWNISGEGAMPFGAEFGFTTGAPGFAGWVGHWAADTPWFDAE
ncbi:SMI1/KNR4 family protein [Streptomyces sp. SP18CS02]|uniref:SMI1/KNR4 family protein n=1 Tax=Streptomyces sp. SP18CS02 TaxID=3002531 RepID=UPI002E7A8B81|nr:SMI1/KNR4 family protein [Streptomyces sp. SP18CS02]MEE1752141.1 SMI1/KNR4 family protein [Streptomyces sp. SP18CS02]